MWEEGPLEDALNASPVPFCLPSFLGHLRRFRNLNIIPLNRIRLGVNKRNYGYLNAYHNNFWNPRLSYLNIFEMIEIVSPLNRMTLQ